MKKVLVFQIFLLVVIVSVSVRTIFSQKPVPIDVTSLTISKPYILSSQIVMTATGLPTPYQSPLSGNGGGAIYSLEGCRPCFLSSILDTGFNSDANYFYGFNIAGYGNDKQVRFHLRNISSPVVLAPTIRLKYSTVFLNAPANIQGKLEIFDGNTLIAFDNDVQLTGTLKAEFSQFWMTTSNGYRRAFDFRKIVYSYSQ